MLAKALLAGALVASAPVYVASNQEPQPNDYDPTFEIRDGITSHPYSSGGAIARRGGDVEAADLGRLRAALTDAERRAEAAESRAADLERQIGEVLDLLEADQPRHRNCAPSRRMMTHFQWLKQNGHDDRARKAITQLVEDLGERESSMNGLAWQLMTDENSAGKFDDVALALAEKMEKKSGLKHQYLDTIALAKFLNGRVDEAIALQKKAIEKCGNSHDYRRRLRTYEAAKCAESCADMAEAAATEPEVTAKPSLHDDDE